MGITKLILDIPDDSKINLKLEELKKQTKLKMSHSRLPNAEKFKADLTQLRYKMESSKDFTS